MKQRGATDEQIRALVGDRLAAVKPAPAPRRSSPFNGLGAPTMDDFMTVIQ